MNHHLTNVEHSVRMLIVDDRVDYLRAPYYTNICLLVDTSGIYTKETSCLSAHLYRLGGLIHTYTSSDYR